MWSRESIVSHQPFRKLMVKLPHVKLNWLRRGQRGATPSRGSKGRAGVVLVLAFIAVISQRLHDFTGIEGDTHFYTPTVRLETERGARLACTIERLNTGGATGPFHIVAARTSDVILVEEKEIRLEDRPPVEISRGPTLHSVVAVDMWTDNFPIESGFRWPVAKAPETTVAPNAAVSCLVTPKAGGYTNLRSRTFRYWWLQYRTWIAWGSALVAALVALLRPNESDH